MNVQSCLHPVRFKDVYTGEYKEVPCGRCPACLNSRARSLTMRLDAERQCWKHSVFFTLTYAPEHLPLLKVISNDGYMTDVTPKRVHPILGSKCFNRFDEYKKLYICSNDSIVQSEKFIKTCLELYDGVPYVCSLDVQRFIKRLRIKIERDFKNQNVSNSIKFEHEQVPKIRYFVAAEYGPTTFKPHYHGVLFFNSDWLVENIYQYIHDCWKLGITDSSYSQGKSNSYCAKYVNSFAHLPIIYQCSSIRTFCLYSKHPALGTLCANSSVQKDYFTSLSLYQVLPKSGGLSVVPLLRSLQDKLYPRLTAFSKFSFANLCTLYRIPSEYEYFPKFKEHILNNKSSVVLTYLSLLRDVVRGEFDNKLFRWFSISHRVCSQSQVWNIPLKHYVGYIYEYYKRLDYEKLSKWYEFSEKYTEEHSVSDLFCYDSLFAKSLLSSTYSLDELDATEIMYLQSFGVDLQKWFSLDLAERSFYRSKFSLDSSELYLTEKAETLFWYDKNSKTKRKNDYLQSHPELLKAFGWLDFNNLHNF